MSDDGLCLPSPGAAQWKVLFLGLADTDTSPNAPAVAPGSAPTPRNRPPAWCGSETVSWPLGAQEPRLFPSFAAFLVSFPARAWPMGLCLLPARPRPLAPPGEWAHLRLGHVWGAQA